MFAGVGCACGEETFDDSGMIANVLRARRSERTCQHPSRPSPLPRFLDDWRGCHVRLASDAMHILLSRVGVVAGYTLLGVRHNLHFRGLLGNGLRHGVNV